MIHASRSKLSACFFIYTYIHNYIELYTLCFLIVVSHLSVGPAKSWLSWLTQTSHGSLGPILECENSHQWNSMAKSGVLSF